MIVVGVGASGALAEQGVKAAFAALADHPQWRLAATSGLHANPAIGGRTNARFVNAAAVIDSALALSAVVMALHAIEHRLGRVRSGLDMKDAARAVDLDVLWSTTLGAPLAWPAVPHPRLLQRPFAVVPAIEALERAGLDVPIALRAAIIPSPTLQRL